jgi:hypothetical protein
MAAALTLTAGIGAASAQTVIVRKIPGGTPVEVQVNATVGGSAKADADGIATVPFDLEKLAGKPEIDALVMVDTCDTTRRVVIVERGVLMPAPEAGCDRRSISGLFLVRLVNTLVIDAVGPSPSLLLIRGSFNPRATEGPRAAANAPRGLVVFAGGLLSSYKDARTLACGDAPDCDADGPWGTFSAGATYWITSFLGAEISYLKPQVLDVRGTGTGFQFANILESHILQLSAKAGIPARAFRIYGQGGLNYTQASLRTNQTVDGVSGTQQFEVETTGWSWQFGGGLEAWVTERVGIFGEFGLASIKGKAETEDAGEIDDRLTSILVGLRFSIGR